MLETIDRLNRRNDRSREKLQQLIYQTKIMHETSGEAPDQFVDL
jgi:hypothetical protein